VTTPFLTTKFFIPHPRHTLVDRPRLVARLDESGRHALTLLCAPAGYGKSTLLAEWIAQSSPVLSLAGQAHPRQASLKFGWLALDADDNDLLRFLGNLLLAFENLHPGVSDQAAAMLAAVPLPPQQTILTILINSLHELDSALFLVLDDYQFITNLSIHQGMAFFLEHLPANLHLVIATRSDPPFSLARLRARRELVEIRAEDLRFSIEETTLLFKRVIALDLSPSDMNSLQERTEGWIAGLQLAALALKGLSHASQPEIGSFVKSFSGSHRYILDYLVEEVLAHQSRQVQDFLLQTSILENLNASLCDSVTGREDCPSYRELQTSQAILENLERANLFLIPLDDGRLWYRYHHLFADLLRARLRQDHSISLPALHTRAADWYEKNQRLPEAVNHTLEAGDYNRACLMVEKLLGRNGIGTLLAWIERIPPEISLTRPWLCLTRAWSAMFLNDVQKIEPFLAAAEQHFSPEDPPALRRTWVGHIACLRAFIASVHDDAAATMSLALSALENLPLEDAANRTFAKYMCGRAHYTGGDFSQATAILSETVSDCLRAGTTNIIAPTLGLLSKIHRIEGKLTASIDLLAAGWSYIERSDPRKVTVAGVALLGRANVLREWNDLEQAEILARRSIELSDSWENPSATCSAYVVLLRVLQDKGNLSLAGEALRAAEESTRGRIPLSETIAELNHGRVCYWLATGELSQAAAWASKIAAQNPLGKPFSISNEYDQITLSRAWIASENFASALQVLDQLAPAAEAGGRFGHLLEIRILQALAHRASGNEQQAGKRLQQGLALGEPRGYLRLFVNAGLPMQTMLRGFAHPGGAHQDAYVRRLLAAFGPPAAQAGAALQPALPDPLTPREADVLRLLAEGMSNRAIAEKLVLAEGTVKYYVHTVLDKLGVSNRTQAGIEAKKHKMI
jgi:LuxR family maltose regulon positive regulatory protein